MRTKPARPLNLVRQKETGKIIDVPAGHYALNPASWPRGRSEVDGRITEVYAEEYELLDASQFERDTEGDQGWVPISPSRSTRTTNAQKS